MSDLIPVRKIRTYQSVQFGKRGKEFTVLMSNEKRVAEEFKDLVMYLDVDKVYLINEKMGCEKIVFTTNIADIEYEEEGALSKLVAAANDSAKAIETPEPTTKKSTKAKTK